MKNNRKTILALLLALVLALTGCSRQYYGGITERTDGVDSAYTMGLLLDRKLIEECGRLQVPGRPRLYRTTKQFLRAFHLSSLDDLPEIPDTGYELLS